MSTAEGSYRELVQRYSKNGQLSPDDHQALELDRAYLKLPPNRAKAIEQEVLASLKSPNSSESPEKEIEQPSNSQSGSDSSASTSHEEKAPPEAVPPTPSQQPHPQVSPLFIDPPDAENSEFRVEKPVKPKDSEYEQRLQQYEDEVFEAIRNKKFPQEAEMREYINHQLPEKLQLTAKDANDARTRATQRNLDGSKPPEQGTNPPIFDERDQKQLTDLARCLSKETRNLQEADRITALLLQKVIAPSQDWIDEQLLRDFFRELRSDEPRKQAIRDINHLWHEHTGGKFGFSRQLAIYRRDGGFDDSDDASIDRSHVLQFSKDIGWWIRGLEFFKPYSCLNFSDTAPAGHFPALWFWQLPPRESFWEGNLNIFKNRGGCGIDTEIIPLFMQILAKCGLPPLPPDKSTSAPAASASARKGRNSNQNFSSRGKGTRMMSELRKKGKV